MKSRKHQIKMKYKRISRPVLCLIAVILAGGMLRGMAPVSALAAQPDSEIRIEEPLVEENRSEEAVPEESAPADSVPEESAPEDSVPEETPPTDSIPEEPVSESQEPESLPSENQSISGSLTAELGGISKSFSLSVTPLADTRAATVNIGNAAQLTDFATKVNNGTYTNTNAVLTADINLSSVSNWTPIGTSAKPYAGTFDGAWHKITNLNTTGNGMFGVTASTALITQLGIESGTISAGSNSLPIGSIVGSNAGTVSKCWNRATVTVTAGSPFTQGGIVGSGGTIEDCINYGAVDSKGKAGNCWSAGISDRGTVKNCYNAGLVTAVDHGAYIVNAMSAAPINSYVDVTLAHVVDGREGYRRGTQLNADTRFGAEIVSKLNAGRTGSSAPWRYTKGGYPYLSGTSVTINNWFDYAIYNPATLVGDGTAGSPYELKSAKDLATFMMKVNSGETGACAKVLADIDLSAYNWVSIGTSKYTGTFDGGYHIISNMKMDESFSGGNSFKAALGMFAITENATIKNIILDKGNITSTTSSGPHETVGSIVGYAAGNTKLINCGARNTYLTKQGSTNYFCAFGGLVGDLRGTSSVTDSYFRGGITNNNGVAASAATYVGGIAGRQCDTTARVSNCYTSVALNNNAQGTKYTAYIIGMNGNRTCVTDCYYDTKFSASVAPNGNGTGKTAAQMRTADFAWQLNATGTPASGRYYPNHVWNQQTKSDGTTKVGNDGFPDFVSGIKDWYAYGATVEAPTQTSGAYQLTDADDLAWFMSQVNSGKTTINGTVTVDIDLTGSSRGGTTSSPVPWVSIGVSEANAYKGTFKGGKRTISYLSGNPLFGYLNGTVDGVIQDNTCKITGTGGLITEMIDGKVSNCLNAGAVSSSVWAGGIVGKMGDGTVEYCGVTANLSSSGASNTLGGIVGYITGTTTKAEIKNCYYRDGTISTGGGCSGHGVAYVNSSFAGKTIITGCYFSGSMSTSLTGRYGITRNDSGITVSNCVYQESTSPTYTQSDLGTALPADKLKSWYGAYLMNGKKTGSGTIWTVSSPKGVYPEWGTLGAVADWESVGEMADKPPVSSVGGTSYYVIDSPGDLAWLAYQVNHPASASSEAYNALIVADIDLFGGEYTGKTKTGNAANDAAAALAWKPIGYTAGASTEASGASTVIPEIYYKGSVKGVNSSGNTAAAQRTIDYLRVDGTGMYNGLFGYTAGASFTNLTVGGHSRVQRGYRQTAGSLAAVVKNGKVTDCENYGTVKCTSSSSDYGTGGIVGTMIGGTISGCKNWGSIIEASTHWGISGGIAGYVLESARITGCSNAGTITYGYYSGGIAGLLQISTIDSCDNGETVSDGEWSGGIAGYVNAGTIKDCKNTGPVNAGSSANAVRSGGIAGEATGTSTVSGCENTGAVGLTQMLTNNYVGGILGRLSNGTIEKNHNTGTVSVGNSTNTIYAGGLVGIVNGGTLRNNYNTGATTGGSNKVYCGGVAGTITSGSVTSNYSCGAGMGSSVSQGVFGLENGGTASNNFFDEDKLNTTAVADSFMHGGRTTAQMKQWGLAYQLNGAPDLSAVSSTVWREAASESENNGYPVFAETNGKMDAAANWSEPGAWVDAYGTKPEGDGSTTAYKITSPEQLAWLAYKVNTDSSNYSKRNADIGKNKLDLFGSRFSGRANTGDVTKALTWIPIGTYSGSLADGELDNLYIPGGSTSVSFIQVLNGGSVSGLSVRGKITATGDQTDHMAGIVARAQNNASIRYCMNWIPVSAARQAGNNYTGGIVGQLTASTVEYCANFADISDSNWTNALHNGGIAGSAENGSTVKGCYNAAAASAATSTYRAGSGHIVSPRGLNAAVTACYYDSDKAGANSNPVSNVTGRTTAQMKTFRATQLLNTSEHTGTGRIWYTASDDSPTLGYPCFVATQAAAKAFTPVEGTALSYGTTTVTGGMFLYLEQVGSADLALLGSDDTLTLGRTTDITANYYKYGTDNANQNVAFGLAGKELSLANRNDSVSASPTLSFYNAAAYNCSSPRYFVLGIDQDGTVYEYTITINAVTGKTLNVTLPVAATMQLKPGQEDQASSATMTWKNENPYPIDFNISKVTPWEKGTNGATHKLAPVAQSVTVTGDEAYKENVHLWLGNVSYGGYIYPSIKYYYDPAKGTIPFGGKLGASGVFSYQYCMDYGAVLSDNNGKFGYDVLYEYSISKEDADNASVKVEAK
ncbi:hypothetical protein LI015_09990 [Enterocloster sp. 210928-DFI.2.20]|uniref:hypothetical protein n=1 Tax=Enterocloster TaxID=2719313 RepID=UPI001D072F6D|nr:MULTISPECIES: hypothetical protein [Enterocloster]MCB7095094.1 hypothetical protein [Enterocloster sp. 210928-DFI.2.20]MCB7355524.1 hypothetical protein [Enterocloster bolteae]